MVPDIDGVLNQADQGRREFLKKVIRGAAFAPPLLASFSLQGLLADPAEGALISTEFLFISNQCLAANQTIFFSNQTLSPCFDFSGDQYDVHFAEILRPDDITAGLDLAGGGYPALNIRGLTGSGGSTWATVLETLVPTGLKGEVPSSGVPAVFRNDELLVLRIDFLITRFNNAKGVGLLAFAFELVGSKGLALVISNAGNTDRLQLLTVEEATGKVAVLKNASLGAGVAENRWYQLVMVLQPAAPCSGTGPVTCEMQVQGQVFRHSDPTNPNSALDPVPVGSTLEFQGPLSFVDFSAGSQVGIVARAVSAVVDSSVTNFCVSCSSKFPG